MGNTNKSGYEIRSELLGMAIGIVESRNSREFDNEMIKAEDQRQPVPPYTTEDIIAEAEKLYQFINTK
tara:strand:- start:106 stop:309 length:204 start_codon:yes stop_codon:yes gene_type:complete